MSLKLLLETAPIAAASLLTEPRQPWTSLQRDFLYPFYGVTLKRARNSSLRSLVYLPFQFIHVASKIVRQQMLAALSGLLRQELGCLEGVEVVGEADNGEAALRQISTLQPDVVFLNIQMPVMGGFEVLSQLTGGHLPAVILVTAFDQHAVRAFEAGAADYLLKPASQARLQQSIERASWLRRNPRILAEGLANLQEIAPTAPPVGSPRKIVGKAGEEYFLLDIEEVLAFQANGDLVWIITSKQRYLAVQNLKTLEERLSRRSFRRIHRNALVNVNQIRKISMITSQRWLMTLNNGQEFVVSKRQARNVRDVLHW